MERKCFLWFSAAIIVLMFIPVCQAEDYRGVNPDQSISPGETIYFDQTEKNNNGVKWIDYSRYIYLGIGDGYLKIEHSLRNDTTLQEEKENIIQLPVTSKVAMLTAVSCDETAPKIKIKLTVLDKDYNLQAEEVNEW